ncbi:thioredoxin family protein [Bacillus sp. 31A1R]|uniref:Thioredoxin family protein n=1 Tax=Robertmurraya mangrovi TaxID=3098077 RepID=A0ABU5IYA9_9BACI|nr:thioredoxin family protein [Bacillus sp. 31A1R]MDZ5472155.1 thioredoxin family protein [Bacillus sp. 31A1R]
MQEWSHKEIMTYLETEHFFILYLYTPLCGTCQVAGKMIDITSKLFPQIRWGKTDLNYIPELAESWSVESVPCLVIVKNKQIREKIYAVQSVPFLFEKIKQLTGS